ncbi:LysR family transcriptional regulator [Acidovorax sp.]|uniref:LysR family transcriptional regulator n=1 Tax=Acidovorax sp. TaxID=1872122 RepID=UPI003D06B9D9
MSTTIAQLRHFIALADSGSFTRAADSTRRSQAAFSRSIAMLEAHLGAALVERSGHRNALTPIGRTVLEHARQVVAQADELHQVVRHHVSGEAGSVRLGMSATPHALLGSRLLHMAAGQAGHMRLQLSGGPQAQQIQALRDRALDALVMDLRSLPGAHADLEVHTLAELPTGALVRPCHPLAQRHPVRFADLTEFAVACTGMSAAMGRLLVQRLGLQAHPDTLITLGSESVADLLDVVSHTDAVYLGIVAPAAPLLAQGRLVALDIPTQGLQSHIAWVQRVARAPNPVLDGIRGQVQAWLGEAGCIEQAADLPA